MMTVPTFADVSTTSDPPADEDSVATEVAVVLAGAAGAALTAAAVKRLVALLGLLRIPRWAVQVTVTVIEQAPIRETMGRGVVGRDNARQALHRRAWFLIESARRILAAGVEARSHGDPITPAVSDAAKKETRYWKQHRQAETRRRTAAAELDKTAAAHGTVLEWRSRRDDHVTPACRVADGHIFDVTHPPRIGLPGLGGPHHGCRCTAVKTTSRPGQLTVDQALTAAGLSGHE